MEEPFVVRSKDFEGPLDLLLSLIEKRKMHVSDISLAQVTNDYLIHIEQMGVVSIANIADFVLTAATLMLIKSRSLLPKISLTQEESESMEELEHRLKLLQLFRSFGTNTIARLFGRTPLVTRTRRITSDEIVFSPPTKNPITVDLLRSALEEVYTNLPQKEHVPAVTMKKVISLEETIHRLLDRVQQGLKMGFKEFAGIKGDRIPKEARQNIIVSFLAVLELVRRGALEIEQNEQFGDISIHTLGVTTPRYT
ncbi:MAG: ScpA family protein [bacterium]|nr:ScpA family protein [bacterium]